MTDNSSGSLTIIIGPMFSGKTTELLRLINRAKRASKKCMVIKYIKDVRYGDEVVTHDLVEHQAGYKCNDLKTLNDKIADYDVIAIDEGSFIKNIELANSWADKGKKVYISALDADYKRNPFEEITRLTAKAEVVIKLTAICKCGNEASFTKRKTLEEEIEVIGGSDIYAAVCRKCYLT